MLFAGYKVPHLRHKIIITVQTTSYSPRSLHQPPLTDLISKLSLLEERFR